MLLQNDDEWLDYESEKKDYSGLKIESLKVSDRDGEEEEQEHEIDEETGEKVPVVRRDGGNVWTANKGGANNRTDSPEPGDEEDTKSTASSSNENAVNVSGGSNDNNNGTAKSSYVPPHLRGVNRWGVIVFAHYLKHLSLDFKSVVLKYFKSVVF